MIGLFHYIVAQQVFIFAQNGCMVRRIYKSPGK